MSSVVADLYLLKMTGLGLGSRDCVFVAPQPKWRFFLHETTVIKLAESINDEPKRDWMTIC